jgi:hypothetical protein
VRIGDAGPIAAALALLAGALAYSRFAPRMQDNDAR